MSQLVNHLVPLNEESDDNFLLSTVPCRGRVVVVMSRTGEFTRVVFFTCLIIFDLPLQVYLRRASLSVSLFLRRLTPFPSCADREDINKLSALRVRSGHRSAALQSKGQQQQETQQQWR